MASYRNQQPKPQVAVTNQAAYNIGAGCAAFFFMLPLNAVLYTVCTVAGAAIAKHFGFI
jgi:hypothetical protein